MSRRPYIRPVSNVSWWLAQPRYIRYMARESSSLFIGAYCGVLVVGLVRLAQGPAAWGAFLNALQSPAGLLFQLLALVFALYHSATWFNVTPKAMVIRIGQKRVPGPVIVGAHYLVWLVVSALILVLVGA